MTGDISMFPNSELLASAEDLLGEEVQTAAADDPIIVDTRSAEAYAAGHIPGAINLQWQSFAIFDGSAPDGTLLPTDELAGRPWRCRSHP